MGEAWSDIAMEIDMKGSSKTTNLTERASIRGSTGKFTKGNGRTDLRRARESGRASLAIPTLASGPKARPTATVCTSGKTETDTKESGSFV